MAKINQPPPRTPQWPWGGPRIVREKLVDPKQFDRRRRLAKKGDPKNPALASVELLEFLGPAHSSDELRLPLPASPSGHNADIEGLMTAPHLHKVAERFTGEARLDMERA